MVDSKDTTDTIEISDLSMKISDDDIKNLFEESIYKFNKKISL